MLQRCSVRGWRARGRVLSELTEIGSGGGGSSGSRASGSDRPWPMAPPYGQLFCMSRPADVLRLFNIRTDPSRIWHLAYRFCFLAMEANQGEDDRPTLACRYRRHFGRGLSAAAIQPPNPSHPPSAAQRLSTRLPSIQPSDVSLLFPRSAPAKPVAATRTRPSRRSASVAFPRCSSTAPPWRKYRALKTGAPTSP